MRAIINSLLLIITFIQKIKSISEFKAIKFDRDKFLIISQEGIYVYDKDLNIKSRYLDPSLHLTAADLKNISFYTIFRDIILFILKNKLYIYCNSKISIQESFDDLSYCQISYIDTRDSYRIIFSIQCINSFNEFVIKLEEFDSLTS